MSVDSKCFGQKRPPLSVTIKGILERYPDGQIFKEMIQNADDAGAKTVWFYVDARQHGTSKLPHADLERFQGPALVSANDACFTDKDWEGIQSFQQSVKADDPFKVGRFGIGFNSVYHLTDLPIIVSGNRLACFEPQEVMWKGESGQSFELTDLLSNSPDIIAPLEGLAGFNATEISERQEYPHTLFRLPLRKQASGLSENVYTIQKVQELLDALREEAKFLVLFLKSVDKIEVINVLDTGHHSLYFRVEVNPNDKASFCSDRETFMRDLHTAHERNGFKISQIISYSAKFSVVVTNPTKNQRGTSEWIVSNCVGSPEASIQTAAEKQKIFPWVGVAVELTIPNESGRIFCFLPMPAETSSGLPVHVHGTFSLNDDRRTLKWPGIEQRNDPMANWNKILVSQLLPGCYDKLLQQLKGYVSPNIFYKAWPKVGVSEVSQFAEMLQPLFSSMFRQPIIWTERTEALQQVGEWISIIRGTFISEGSTLPSVVQQTLSKCSVKLVTVPGNIWAAIRFSKMKVSVVSPQLACNKFQRFPRSYSNIDPIGKREILQYCLKDNIVHYNDLGGLNLLPLANGTFTNFDQGSCVDRQLVYLCNSNFPKSLLPNLDHMLVDINDMELQSSLSKVASSQKTKLRQLGTREVASLLPQAMPQEWKGQSLVVMPNSNFSTSWLTIFWEWLQGKDLDNNKQEKDLELFNNKLIVPVYESTLNKTDSFCLSRLSPNSSIVYKDTNQLISCSSSLLSSLYKMKVMVCLQNEFTFVKHPQLSQYVNDFDVNGVLDAIGHQSNYTRAAFSQEEAKSLREFLSRIDLASSLTITVLNNLSIFNSASNSSSQLYSIASAESQSLAKAALVEPSNSLISVKNIPHNLILFCQRDYNQIRLLQELKVTFPSDVDLLLNYIFPSICSQIFPDHLVDGLMTEVIDSFQTLKAKCSHPLNLSEAIASLPFLKTSTECRKSPQDLYDPTNEEVKALYKGEDVFPSSLFETTQRVQVLKQCGLRDTIQPQEVLDIIKSISTAFSLQPVLVSSIRLKRAKAILKYVSKMVKARLSSVAETLYTLATTQNWLPVMSDRPQDYPCQLPWKGSKYKCHLVSLSSSVAVTSTHTCSTLPYLVGTQMFVTEPLVDLKVAQILHTDWGQFVVPHFKRLKQLKEELTPDDLEFLVHKVYSFLNVSTAHIEQIYSIEKWIFLQKQKQFVSPAVVALQYNDKFPQDLQPYVHILPDTLLKYKKLFGPTSQVASTVTRAQILSVLGRIREEVRAGVHRYREEEGPTMVILNWLTNNGTKDVTGETNVLVPVESDSKWPQLVKASKVVYTDNDLLKTFLQKSDKDSSHTFVHNIVDPRLAKCLGVVPLSEFLDISEDAFADAGQYEPQSPSTIILPDEDFVLHDSNRLSYNDAPWAPKDEQYSYVNNLNPRELAITPGVSPVRCSMRKSFASDARFDGITFGQHEELTQRIQNILRDYPFDITVLKELLQNADDAKATKMYFILDKRTHGSTSVISENWTNLQGPALLVWNDSEFTKEDMDGIQKLGLGSKRSDSETIGQYGIGFNVVYHLTDCPSFITGGKHMCIFDPHCSYVPGASVSNPGMKFDLKKDNFWDRFPDMKSAYLQSSLNDGSPDFSKGSLFRFPLRCTPTLVKHSKIMVKSDIGNPDTLTAEQMQHKLKDWSLDMKHALFFVNHVREMQFFVIENDTHVLVKQEHFETRVDECGLKRRESLYRKFSEFNDTTGNRSCITSYPLTICDIGQYSTAVSKREEKWLIQEGVGDIEHNHQSWEYTAKVKPRHGIALPLEQKCAKYSTKHGQENRSVECGQVFCFLPLPLQSKLPVHVNGQFFLHTNRRDLWKPTTPGTQDKPTNWNESLFKALASSYAHLLVEAQPYLIPAHSITKWHKAKEIVKHYYDVFPNAHKLEQPYLDLAKNMYKILIKLNSKVLAVINGTNSGSTLSSQESTRFHIQWHPIRNISNPSSQIYFLSKDANVKPILESIGMKVTVAPSQIRTYLNEALEGEKQLEETTPENVYSYYTCFSYQASHDKQFPCKLNETVFENVEKYKIFMQCLLKPSEENPKVFQFPKCPLNLPLLLTADETLRKFSCEQKVIISEYSHLFPQSQDKFLHPNLIDIEFTTDYFICVPSPTSCNTNIEDLQEFHFIYDVFSKELPISLRTSETCTDYNKHISKTKLKEFWDCLSSDLLFEHFQSSLTKHLALLPSKDGQLFSTASDILPIYPPQPNQDLNSLPNQGDTVYQVLVDLKLPFLETDLICSAKVDCPSLNDHKKVLEILHHLYCNKDIPQISNNWEVITKLISYFKNINFETNHSSCEHIRSLPLFENNVGTFISLKGKMALIWPTEVSTIGCEKWLPLYDVIFLKPDGDWKRLGSMNELNIRNISAKEVYTTYIFKAFSVLNESERYKHLNHIRTSVITTSLFQSDQNIALHVVSEQTNSDHHLFVTVLKDLPCIGGDDEILKCVREFCDHKEEVFITFSDEYQFLPTYFKESSEESSWLEFFKYIGLKATLSQEEYLHLCNRTSIGQHVSPREASTALVTYLFSKQTTILKWYNDRLFLQNVSDIPFLCTKPLPSLTWICPAAQTCKKIMSHNEQIHMTKFKEAVVSKEEAVSKDDFLIWTVKPIVSLKKYCYLKVSTLLRNLQVIQNLDVSHVIQNITNISRRSKFADQKLFHNFSDSLMTKTEGVSLTTAMSNQFAFLASKMNSLLESNYKALRSLSCVPVPAALWGLRTWQVVLVKPTTVVMREPDLKEFHPCIHSLPSQLYPSERLLLKIGVAESLQLTHIQIVLEASFKASNGQEPEPNTKCRVVAAVKRLHRLLEELPKENRRDGLVEKSLSPLYLPARDKTLAKSTSLLYADNPSYRGCTQLNLSEIDFNELDIDQQLFGFLDSSLCNLLPEAVRPVGLSKICKQRVNENCELMEDSTLAKKLKETLTLRTLSKACLMVMKTHARGKEISKSVEQIIVGFINDISNSVTTVEKLLTVVCLKDSGKEIGNSSETCFMERSITDSRTSYKLFLDSRCDDDPVEMISVHLLEILTDCQPTIKDVQLYQDVKPLLVKILKAVSNDKIKMILNRYGISLDDNEMDKCEFVIGEHIPTCWHHRLDQDINHVFHSGEKVGFDKDQSDMIYAEILDPVLTEGCCSFDSVPNLEMRYNIIVSTDGECCEVSVLDLYKFILSSVQEDVPETEQETTDLVPHEESDTSQLRDHLRHENEEMIKSELMKLLNEIMKLTETNKRKAIHRLYLKWHPDKNLNNPELAETIFQFFLAEIEHRECSSSLQKERWEKAAKEHGFYCKSEHSNKNSGQNQHHNINSWEPRSGGEGTGSIPTYYPPFHSEGSESSVTGWEERQISGRYIPPFDKEDFQVKVNPREGRRWLRQAEVELIALEALCDQLDEKPTLSCFICFAAHQVAEKALKAGKYYVCGLTVDALRIHDLTTHASGLQHERPIEAVGLVDKASSLNGYYLRTRYPDCWKPPTIPADHFTAEKALAARRNAKAILEIIQRILV